MDFNNRTRYVSFLVQVSETGTKLLAHGVWDSRNEAIEMVGRTYRAWKEAGDHTILTTRVVTVKARGF